jgi:hypothetical protein
MSEESTNFNNASNEESFNKALGLVLAKISRHEQDLKSKQKRTPHKNLYVQGLITFIISISTIFLTSRVDLLKQVNDNDSKHAAEILNDGTAIRKEQAEKIHLLEKNVDEWRDKYYTSLEKYLEKYNALYLISENLKKEIQQLQLKIDELNSKLEALEKKDLK